MKFADENHVPAHDFANTNDQAYVLNRDGHRIQAMAARTTGWCNHCHTGGSKLAIPDRLMAGPWAPPS